MERDDCLYVCLLWIILLTTGPLWFSLPVMKKKICCFFFFLFQKLKLLLVVYLPPFSPSHLLKVFPQTSWGAGRPLSLNIAAKPQILQAGQPPNKEAEYKHLGYLDFIPVILDKPCTGPVGAINSRKYVLKT